MRKDAPLAAAVCLASWIAAAPGARELPLSRYRDKMRAGWIGQMAGVGWGGPTEFKSKGAIIPEEKLPAWKPEMINQFNQDDIYVELTFVRTLEQRGFDVSLRQAGIDWANSGYPLWHANQAGRTNLRNGIAPPDSGHPRFNKHADDIDYQIEADFSGLIAPGLPNVVIRLGEKFGRLMNYGDGLYGGQFVGGMYAAAFFEDDPAAIVEAGLACIPRESQYAECIRDVLAGYRADPGAWEKTWERIEQKYQRTPAYRRASCTGPGDPFNIDAKINGAYIAMGLLFGRRDPDRTITIATRCGQDSDCNPSSAAGVLFTTIGYAKLPERFTSALNDTGVFSHTAYNFPALTEACEKIAREAVVRGGGRIEKDAGGEERFVIPIREPKPTALETCWEPGPIANSRYTEEEMAQIAVGAPIGAAVDRFARGWKVAHCGDDMDPGLRPQERGKKNVLVTHPLDRATGCVLSKKVEIPAGKKTALRLVVGHHPQGDWTLIVKANGTKLFEETVGAGTAADGWRTVQVDLTAHAGKAIDLELVNQPSGWSYEAAYWSEIAIRSE